MTTSQEARQLDNIMELADAYADVAYYKSNDRQRAALVEALKQLFEKADVSAYREAMNADVGIDYKSPGNLR